MLVLVAYSFTFAIYAAATGASTEATNLSIGIVDEDHSDLSRCIADGLTPPTFKPAIRDTRHRKSTPRWMRNVFFTSLKFLQSSRQTSWPGRQPSVQIDVDATAVAQASMA